MYNFLEQRTKEKNTSSEEVSVAPKAIQFHTKHERSKETFLPLDNAFLETILFLRIIEQVVHKHWIFPTTIHQKLKVQYKGVMTSSECRQSESLKGRSNTSQISCLASSDLYWQSYFLLVLKSVSRNCSSSVRGTQLTCLYRARLPSAVPITAQTWPFSNCNDLSGSPPTQLKNLTPTATQH